MCVFPTIKSKRVPWILGLRIYLTLKSARAHKRFLLPCLTSVSQRWRGSRAPWAKAAYELSAKSFFMSLALFLCLRLI